RPDGGKAAVLQLALQSAAPRLPRSSTKFYQFVAGYEIVARAASIWLPWWTLTRFHWLLETPFQGSRVFHGIEINLSLPSRAVILSALPVQIQMCTPPCTPTGF